jgi:hypothetical protein
MQVKEQHSVTELESKYVYTAEDVEEAELRGYEAGMADAAQDMYGKGYAAAIYLIWTP